jgi:hypothetical protein
LLLIAAVSLHAHGQDNPRIHIVYMGGTDCPPCVTWRALEYPKLAATDVFKRIRYTHVEKVIRSTVPPKFFLPTDVKPLKEKLDYAANGMSGSPHTVIMVDGEVFDYKFGTYSASELEARLLAIESNRTYEYSRCTRRQDQRVCLQPK